MAEKRLVISIRRSTADALQRRLPQGVKYTWDEIIRYNIAYHSVAGSLKTSKRKPKKK